MFLFGFSHSSATSGDMNAINSDFVESYAGELNFCNKRNTEKVSQSSPINHGKENPEHQLLFIETEKEEDEVKSSYADYLKFKDNFIIILFFSPSSIGMETFDEKNYQVSQEATLPSDHFLFLEYQVFRI